MTSADPPTPTSTPPRSGPMYAAGRQIGSFENDPSRDIQHRSSFQSRAQNQLLNIMPQAQPHDPFFDSRVRPEPSDSVTNTTGGMTMSAQRAPVATQMNIDIPSSAHTFLQVSNGAEQFQYLQPTSTGLPSLSTPRVSDSTCDTHLIRRARSGTYAVDPEPRQTFPSSGSFAECDYRDFPGVSNPLSTPALSPVQTSREFLNSFTAQFPHSADSLHFYPSPHQDFHTSHAIQQHQHQSTLGEFSNVPVSSALNSTNANRSTAMFSTSGYTGNLQETHQRAGLSASPRNERSSLFHGPTLHDQAPHGVSRTPFYEACGSSDLLNQQNSTIQLHGQSTGQSVPSSAYVVLPSTHTSQMAPVPKELRPYDRRFLVRGVPAYTEARELLKLFQDLASKIGPSMVELDAKGQFWIGFTDMREAQKFTRRVLREHPSWTLEPVSDATFKQGSKLVNTQPSVFDDQVLVFVYGGPGSEIPASDVITAVKPLLELVGPVYAIKDLALDTPVRGARFTMNELIVRYFDSQHAANAVKALNAVRENSFVIEVLPYNKGMEAGKVRHWTVPTHETTRDRRADPYTSPEDRDRSPATPDRSPVSQVICHPHILAGGDTRTTVMLKNIPNGMRWIDLKAIVDATSACRYDFLYLRMDFEENQNVGYAFVNFITPGDIVPFVTAREGKHWPGYNRPTEKIAEISYATSQGKAALVEKFRNSPVMLDLRDNRPKLFYTVGPLAGQEAPFPPVNNFWTLAKSVDRSKKSGLYRVGARSGGAITRGRRHSEGTLETPIRGNRRDPHDRDDDDDRTRGHAQIYHFAPSNSPGASRHS